MGQGSRGLEQEVAFFVLQKSRETSWRKMALALGFQDVYTLNK